MGDVAGSRMLVLMLVLLLVLVLVLMAEKVWSVGRAREERGEDVRMGKMC